MESFWRQSDEMSSPAPAAPQRQPGGLPSRPRGGQHKTSQFGGIHLRRDKRFPMSRQQVSPEMLPAPPLAPQSTDPEQSDSLRLWKEAVMLWLSWNNTHEKLTAKMCKPGQDQKKIEALMDEADQLRRRAIDLSEQLFR